MSTNGAGDLKPARGPMHAPMDATAPARIVCQCPKCGAEVYAEGESLPESLTCGECHAVFPLGQVQRRSIFESKGEVDAGHTACPSCRTRFRNEDFADDVRTCPDCGYTFTLEEVHQLLQQNVNCQRCGSGGNPFQVFDRLGDGLLLCHPCEEFVRKQEQ